MPEKHDVARIFVGADRSQLLAVKVLEYSITRRTDLKVQLRSMHDLDLPDPKDVRHGKRTGFSFTRFAIPQLAGRDGRALYLDADMLVLRDLRELYELPFAGAKVLIQEELPKHAEHWGKPGAPKKRVKQCSVMLLDCAALDWEASKIIAGLDGRYTYEDLMFDLCILPPEAIGYSVPFAWNSLETYAPGVTGLIHYTDMPTQPWVDVSNRNGWVWINEVRDMLSEGALSLDEVRGEVERGYFRPSLLRELDGSRAEGPPAAHALAQFRSIDDEAGFVPHAEVTAQARLRATARAATEEPGWLGRGRHAFRRFVTKIRG